MKRELVKNLLVLEQEPTKGKHMAKSKKDKASKKALSYGNLYTQEAVTQFLVNFGKQPDTDEVLRKAGIARHKLRVLLDDDEIAQATETRVDECNYLFNISTIWFNK